MNPESMMHYNSIFGQNDTEKGFLSYNVYRLETPLLVYPACGGVYFFKSPIGLFKCSSVSWWDLKDCGIFLLSSVDQDGK